MSVIVEALSGGVHRLAGGLLHLAGRLTNLTTLLPLLVALMLLALVINRWAPRAIDHWQRLRHVDALPGPKCTNPFLGNVPLDVLKSMISAGDHRNLIISNHHLIADSCQSNFYFPLF